MERQLRDVMRGVEPRMPLRDVMTLREEFDALFPEDRTIADLMRLVAGLAFALGLFGVASVMACTLAERTRELGIRAALGASSGRLTRDVLRPALVSGLAGIVIGLVLFALMSRGLASHVHGVSALDPATLAAAAAVLLAASLAAAWVPTRRAARTDPTITLRAE
jgi:ABC-type antimicrobial peptide transport system permease subunit